MDYRYIADLVLQARGGDSDAFAELYASTYQKQYLFACTFLQDGELAREALRETYVSALNHLSSLNEPRLFVSWLNQINFRICYNISVKRAARNPDDDPADRAADDRSVLIGGVPFTLRQIMALPFSESQALFLYFFRGMPIRRIANLMDIGAGSVKLYIASGKKRLAQRKSV